MCVGRPCQSGRKLTWARPYSLWGLNPRPMAHKTIALTTELREQVAHLQRGGFRIWVEAGAEIKQACAFALTSGFCGGAQHAQPPWPNGQGVGLLIRRLRVRVPQGVHCLCAEPLGAKPSHHRLCSARTGHPRRKAFFFVFAAHAAAHPGALSVWLAHSVIFSRSHSSVG